MKNKYARWYERTRKGAADELPRSLYSPFLLSMFIFGVFLKSLEVAFIDWMDEVSHGGIAYRSQKHELIS